MEVWALPGVAPADLSDSSAWAAFATSTSRRAATGGAALSRVVPKAERSPRADDGARGGGEGGRVRREARHAPLRAWIPPQPQLQAYWLSKSHELTGLPLGRPHDRAFSRTDGPIHLQLQLSRASATGKVAGVAFVTQASQRAPAGVVLQVVDVPLGGRRGNSKRRCA